MSPNPGQRTCRGRWHSGRVKTSGSTSQSWSRSPLDLFSPTMLERVVHAQMVPRAGRNHDMTNDEHLSCRPGRLHGPSLMAWKIPLAHKDEMSTIVRQDR
mgnify:CR=1 FL=1